MTVFDRILPILVLALVALSQERNTNQKVEPHFTRIPPVTTYVQGVGSTALTCGAWPPNAFVTISRLEGTAYTPYSGSARLFWGMLPPSDGKATQESLIRINGVQQMPTPRLETDSATIFSSESSTSVLQNFSETVSQQLSRSGPNQRSIMEDRERALSHGQGVQLQLRGGQYNVRDIEKQTFHCQAETALGTMISEPFSVTKAGLGTYGNPLVHTKNVSFLVSNMAFIDCELPTNSRPADNVVFRRNDQLLTGDKRMKQVTSLDGSMVTLLISTLVPGDQGLYTCEAVNPVTQERLISPVTYNLNVIRTLEIVDVKVEDAGDFLCSSLPITSTVRLEVIPKLRITTAPRDVLVTQLGQSVQLECVSSDANAKPMWLHNGQVIQPSRPDTVLTIKDVSSRDLGIYQCIVSSFKSDGMLDQWVSATAVVSMFNEKIISKPSELARLVPDISPESTVPTPSVTSPDLTPVARRIIDNLQTMVTFNTSDSSILAAYKRQWSDARISQELQKGDRLEVTYQLEYITQQADGSIPPALERLVGSQYMKWTDPMVLDVQPKRVPKQNTWYAYVGEPVIQPEGKYRFRVRALNPETGTEIMPVSDWSPVHSVNHISAVDRPLIKAVKTLSNGRIHVKWLFKGNGTSKFEPDRFNILARPVISPSVDSSVKVVDYGGYKSATIEGGSADNGIISGLNQTAGYQVVVYGIRGQGDNRVITRYSKAYFIKMTPTGLDFMFSLFGPVNNNKLMYIILGALTGFMLLVMGILLIMCCCKQRRSRRRRREKANGYPYPYKDVGKYPQRGAGDAMDGMGGVGGMSHQNGMMMNTLQRPTNEQTAHQQAEQYAASIAQAQAQAQAMMMGSNMQLANVPYYSHHQSHQSLLMPQMQGAAGTMPAGQMPQQLGSPQNVKPSPFYSGTLPSGPRYMRQYSAQTGEYGPGQPQPMMYPNSHYMMQGAGPLGSSTLQRPPQMAMGSQQRSHYHPASVSGARPQDISVTQMDSPANRGFNGSQQQLHMMQQAQQHHQQQQQAYYGGNGHHMTADGESIYSYFSQQDNGAAPGGQTPGSMATPLNPLPEEGGHGCGYGGDGSVAGSPAQGGHRHHRRRRRKNQTGSQLMMNGGGGGMNGAQYSDQANDSMDQPVVQNGSYHMTNGHGDHGQPPPPPPQQQQQRFPSFDAANGMPGQPLPPAMSQAGMMMMNGLMGSQPLISQAGGSMPPPNQPPPPPPAFGTAKSPPNAGFPNPPRIRDYSEYGIPRAVVNGGHHETDA